jgi:UDPglucose 6-dehydrogenase
MGVGELYMKIAVIGLWHLGMVTAACLAHKGFNVVAYDDDEKLINDAKKGILPISEPRLNDLVAEEISKNNLHFTHHLIEINDANLIWITYDTPVDGEDNADINFVFTKIENLFPHIKQNAVIIISSQLQVGSTTEIEKKFNQKFPNKTVSFACSPENLRLGNAIKVFLEPDRIIIGLNNLEKKHFLQSILSIITPNIVWMSVESAEMTKHAINAFLATSVAFINEISVLCEQVGANAREVEQGLKSEMRIGPKAYLRPGNAFAGGTLARDVNYLLNIGQRCHYQTPLFSGILESNQQHKKWLEQKLTTLFGKDLYSKKIALLGLTYKPNTDTLRRSSAIEACLWLKKQNATIIAYDPAIKNLPVEYSFIQLKTSAKEALRNSDLVIIFTPWLEFELLKAEDYITSLQHPIVIDVTGFLYDKLSASKDLKYLTVGKDK